MKLDRATAENARLRKALDDLTPALADMKKRIAALEAQPLPAKAALRSIAKSADGADERLVSADDAVRRLASLPAHERALALTKLSLANPAPPRFLNAALVSQQSIVPSKPRRAATSLPVAADGIADAAASSEAAVEAQRTIASLTAAIGRPLDASAAADFCSPALSRADF